MLHFSVFRTKRRLAGWYAMPHREKRFTEEGKTERQVGTRQLCIQETPVASHTCTATTLLNRENFLPIYKRSFHLHM
jgi:hypothetical protein